MNRTGHRQRLVDELTKLDDEAVDAGMSPDEKSKAHVYWLLIDVAASLREIAEAAAEEF